MHKKQTIHGEVYKKQTIHGEVQRERTVRAVVQAAQVRVTTWGKSRERDVASVVIDANMARGIFFITDAS